MLGGADVEFDFANGMIRRFQPEDCEQSELAYWDKTQPYSVIDIAPANPGTRRIEGTAFVNGVPIKTWIDTGTMRSVMSASAALKAGVKLTDPKVHPSGLARGFGAGAAQTWLAPFRSFKFGDEEVRDTQLRIGIIGEGDVMILGADFLLSHRVYVANSQHRLYFTYNGGPVFRLDDASAKPPATAPIAISGDSTDEPKDADGFARRGAAFVARRDYAQALIDYNRAVALEPNNPQYLYGRAIALSKSGQPASAIADLDQVLKLTPADRPALMARGGLYLAQKDTVSARADFQAAARADPDGVLDAAKHSREAHLFEAAIAQYDLWIADNPKDPGLAEQLNGRCWVRALWGQDLDKALADCDAALAIKPRDANALDSRGLVRLRLGQFDLAIADYDQALHLNPESAWSRYGRGLAELHKGMKAQAEADVRAAFKAQPSLYQQAVSYGVTR